MSIFETCNYRSPFPLELLVDLLKARRWVRVLATWCNAPYSHGVIGFVTL